MNAVLRNRFASMLMSATALGTAGAAAAAGDAGGGLDVITIEARRKVLAELRAEIVRLEDVFYSQYNALNPVDDFDIHCVKEAVTGTRLEKRSCRAIYQEKAFEEEGQEIVRFRQRINAPQSRNPTGVPERYVVIGDPPVTATVRIEARRKEYSDNMKAVVAQHPGLLAILRERADVLERYQSLQKSRTSSSSTEAEAEAPR